MKKLIYILLLTLLLNSCNKISTNPFNELIKDYPHNPNKLYEYENIYNESSNIIYSINKVNYPLFLTPKSYKFLAFKSNNIFFVNTNFSLNKNYIPQSLIEINNVDYIKRTNQRESKRGSFRDRKRFKRAIFATSRPAAVIRAVDAGRSP